jgi:hypothetical protein
VVDQEQTTTTEATDTTQSQTADEGSPTSTTETSTATTEESIDLSKSGETEEPTDKSGETETEETDEQKAERAEREALFGAPAEGEAYQLEGLPEGTVIDEEALADIAPIARQLGLSNKGLSAVAGVYAEKILPRVAQQTITGIEQNVVAQRSEWEGQARDAITGKLELKNAAGEPISFNGMDMKAVRGEAAKALDKLAPEGFRQFLDETGLAVHPAMVAFAYNAGQLLAEDREIEDTETGSGKATPASVKRRAGGMDPQKFFDH